MEPGDAFSALSKIDLLTGFAAVLIADMLAPVPIIFKIANAVPKAQANRMT
jgi:hypothetical protein